MAKKNAKPKKQKADVAEITSADRSRLADLETALTRCQSSFVEAGNALREIRDGRLYRGGFATFEAYCQERWHFTPRYGRMLVQAAEVVNEVVDKMGTIVPIAPATESQARELARVETPDERAAVWGRVVERAGGDAAKITAKIVHEEVAKVLPAPPPRASRGPAAAIVMPTTTEPTVTAEEEKPKPAKPAPTVDEWGIPIQPHAVEAFAAVPEFKRLAALLREVQQGITALAESPGGHHLLKRCQFVKTNTKAGGRWVLAALDNALAAIQDATPKHTDCPYAHNVHMAHDDGCTLCLGKRYTGNLKFHQVPADLVAATKAHYGVADEAEVA